MKKGSADVKILTVLVLILIGLVIFFGLKYTNKSKVESVVDKVVETKTEVVEKEVYKLIDVSKNLNKNDTVLSKIISDGGKILFEIKLEDGKIYLRPIDASYAGKHEVNKFYEIAGVSGKIVDFNVTYNSISNSVPKIVVLMDDGTLYSVKYNTDVNGQEFVGEKKLEGYENIVRIDSVTHSYEYSFEGSSSIMTYKTLVATDKNGVTKIVNAF